MDADQYQKIKEIFQSVLEAPADERQELLNERCGTDPGVRAEVERLLDSYESGFLENPVAAAFAENGLHAGETLGHYTIVSKIGSGGMGEVYLAEDGRLGRRVAIKLLPEVFTEDEDRLRRFEQEARTASALNHPNILTVHEIGETGNTRYIATEYIDGETLRARLNRGPLSISEALDIAVQCASALAAAHENNIIHRDIKPENIMIRRDNLVKVLDFGLAKLSISRSSPPAGGGVAAASADGVVGGHDAPTERHVRTAPGMIMGTVQYMSPEQTRGHATDARTDIWSLGVVIYEMAAGSPPFVGENTADLIAEIVKTHPSPLLERVFDVPELLSKLVEQTLEKNRDDRHQTAKDLVMDLKGLRRSLDIASEQSGIRTSIFKGESPEPGNGDESPRDLTRSVFISGKHFVLIGRRRELAEISSLLRDPKVRLLTLTGVGGTGKTTIAKVIVDEIRDWFESNITFVDLSWVANPDSVLSAVSQALYLKENGSRPILDILKDKLRGKPTLLIIDNFEQVASAAPILKELIDCAPALKILVTSRVLLELSFETELRISTLEVPDITGQPRREELAKNDSVRLFVERATAADPSFEFTDDNAYAIAAICRSLDGLPLAIELAAARVRVLSPKAILERLESRLYLLTGGGKDLPVRQQSVRATVGWSYDLLSDGEQTLFRRLAVFSDGFTITAAEAVVGQIADGVLNGVTSLFNASLVVKMTGLANEPRFRMLEVVREYALELFESIHETNEVRLRHALYFLAVSEEAEEHLQISRSAEWSDRLEMEHENLRLALSWSFENRLDLASRLTAALPMFWIQRGYLTEGQRWLRAAINTAHVRTEPSVRCRQLMGLGVLSKFQGDLEGAAGLFNEALEIGRDTSDQDQIAWSKRQLGSVASLAGDLERAQRFLEESLAINRERCHRSYTAFTLAELGSLFHAQGDLESARCSLEESLGILREIGYKAWIGLTCWELGTIAYRNDDFPTARSYYTESLMVARELDFKSSISNNLDGFAALSAKCMDLGRSTRLAAAAETLRTSIGYEMVGGDRGFLNSYISELRSSLSKEELSAFWEEGRKLKLNDAIDLALHVGQS